MKLTLDTLAQWLWSSADIMRGTVDSSDFKNYIFGLLFLKRANDQFLEEANNAVANDGITLAEALEDEDLHDFFIPREAYWSELTKKTENIGVALDKAFAGIEEDNEQLQGVMTAVHFGDSEKLPDALLSRLLQHFNKYSLANADLDNPDILGNAYEYLIREFAGDAGKAGGEFYTPKEVVQLVVGLIKPQAGNSVYDPTCGSGGMLIESAHYIKNNGGTVGKHINVSLYGQERNLGTWAIAMINMIVHGFKDSDLRKGDTLAAPKHESDAQLMTFDRVIANPPFSLKKWWSPAEVDVKSKEDGKEIAPKYNDQVSDEYGRFKYGIPPRGYGDLAFVQHMISVLKHDGRMGVVLPHGILFRGGTEGKIRKGILNDDLIEAIVGLPEKLFYNTGIPASIIVINKSKPANLKDKVVFIDASSEYKDGKNQNTLEPKNIAKVIEAYDSLEEIDKFMRVVDMSEIAENDYNLNISRYIDTSEEEVIVDIKYVRGEITELEGKEQAIDEKLNAYLKELGL
ncbi:MAG: type I restriction-modification system subunit M [Candidatus Endonucleobacter bathymodioli]|uniref:site-specific DNA-methyltransferase (adenine-specific) n=1 Tax=Candidatus Endonucleibacter bathymodioli TaxID=539814 RepID=A0AA90NSS2_9GAMM|nr:type I restriction-modification system subunit M [Candidatus Endonucleobacter bathymodioli]MDP0590372.1 type I restriction-modification system subunit M [Candidatus Endonucleobacter bathymodioli]